MIRKLGRLHTKSRSIGPVSVLVPKSEVYNLSNVKTGEFGGGLQVVDSGSDTIAYTNRVPGGDPHAANLCRQFMTRTRYGGDATSRQRVYSPLPTPTQYTEYSGGHSDSSHTTAIGLAKTAFGVNLGAAVLGAGGQGYINTACNLLRPDLTTVSIPNFLLDIDDIKSLFQLWKSNLSLARNVAGAHLNYKFGWKPTIGDLTSLVNAVKGLQTKLRAFENSLCQTFTGETTLFHDTITKSGSFNVGSAINRCDWTGTVKRSLRAYLVWRPQPLAVMSGFEKTLRGLMDSLGFELNPRILWDATPFTFVLDWFFGIGGWLDNFRIDALELPITYVDSYLQYKEEIHIESCKTFDIASTSTQTQWPSWVTTEKFFHRLPLFPDFQTFSGLGWRLPTLNQAELLVSLATVLSGRKA